jgi:lipid A 3-O-deacylase
MRISAVLCVIACLFLAIPTLAQENLSQEKSDQINSAQENAVSSNQTLNLLTSTQPSFPYAPSTAPLFQTAPAPPAKPAAPDTTEEVNATTYYHNGVWESGFFAGGGEGLGSSDYTQFFYTGVRAGTVLTNDHLGSVLRGNFEFAGEFMPVYEVLGRDPVTYANDNIYGVSIKPVILRWNFTGAKRFAPYITLEGGMLFSTKDVPPDTDGHHTSWFNFTPQGALGVNIFTRPGQAVNVEVELVHHSSASLGTFNPGYNASFFFSFGYTWIHRWRK